MLTAETLYQQLFDAILRRLTPDTVLSKETEQRIKDEAWQEVVQETEKERNG